MILWVIGRLLLSFPPFPDLPIISVPLGVHSIHRGHLHLSTPFDIFGRKPKY